MVDIDLAALGLSEEEKAQVAVLALSLIHI